MKKNKLAKKPYRKNYVPVTINIFHFKKQMEAYMKALNLKNRDRKSRKKFLEEICEKFFVENKP